MGRPRSKTSSATAPTTKLTSQWDPANLRPQDWPRDRGERRVILHGQPDHLGRQFHDILFWKRNVRMHHVAFDVPPE